MRTCLKIKWQDNKGTMAILPKSFSICFQDAMPSLTQSMTKEQTQREMCAKSLRMGWEPVQTVGMPKKLGTCMTSRETNTLQCFACWPKERR